MTHFKNTPRDKCLPNLRILRKTVSHKFFTEVTYVSKLSIKVSGLLEQPTMESPTIFYAHKHLAECKTKLKPPSPPKFFPLLLIVVVLGLVLSISFQFRLPALFVSKEPTADLTKSKAAPHSSN
jgi:hypothetical protein